MAGEVEDFFRQLIALTCGNRNVERLNLLRIQFAEQTRAVGLSQHLTSRARHTSGGAISLKTPLTATTAEAAFLTTDHRHMSQFTGKSVMTIHQLTVDHDTRPHSGSEGDDDEVLHSTCHAINHLAHGSRIGVVGQRHRNAERLAEHVGQRHHPFPWQIRSIFNGS